VWGVDVDERGGLRFGFLDLWQFGGAAGIGEGGDVRIYWSGRRLWCWFGEDHAYACELGVSCYHIIWYRAPAIIALLLQEIVLVLWPLRPRNSLPESLSRGLEVVDGAPMIFERKCGSEFNSPQPGKSV